MLRMHARAHSGPHVDFIEKARRAEEAGAAAVIVVNYASAESATLLTMGLPKALRGTGVSITIPALFISGQGGEAVKAAIAAAPHHGAPTLTIGRSKHFGERRERGVGMAGGVASTHSAAVLSTSSDFVPLTMPTRFLWPGHPEGYVPRSGQRPPREVQSAASQRTAGTTSLLATRTGQRKGGGGAGANAAQVDVEPVVLVVRACTGENGGRAQEAVV